MHIVLLVLFTILGTVSYSQTTEFILDNGLKILVKEDHRAPVIVTMIGYNVGSADEPGGLTGISHALEHLMFKGTTKYPLGTFSNIIAAKGGQENALTSHDFTFFYEKMASKDLATSLALEADRMHNLLFDEHEFQHEMKVIQEERRMRTNNNPQALTFERFLATAHLTPPYHHPVIGWMNDIKHLTVEDAKQWYQNYYNPNNALLIVVGDVIPKDVFELAKKYFGQLKKGPLIEHRQQQEPPRLGKKITQVLTSSSLSMLIIGVTVPTVNTVTKDSNLDPYALELIAGLLDAGDSGRLTTDLIQRDRIANNINVSYNLYARYQTQFIIAGTPNKSQSLADLKRGILSELTQLKKELVTVNELQRVKTQILAQKTFEKDSLFGQAMEIGVLEINGISKDAQIRYEEQLNRITPLIIQNTAERYFQAKEMTEAIMNPSNN